MSEDSGSVPADVEMSESGKNTEEPFEEPMQCDDANVSCDVAVPSTCEESPKNSSESLEIIVVVETLTSDDPCIKTGASTIKEMPTSVTETDRTTVSEAAPSDPIENDETQNGQKDPELLQNFEPKPGTSKEYPSNYKLTSEVLSEKILQQPTTPMTALLEEVSSKEVSIYNDSVIVDTQSRKEKVVNIYTDDVGPHWYDVHGNIVSKAIVPSRVSEAFEMLPIHGRPTSRSSFKEFQRNKLMEFVGSGLTEEEFDKVEEFCSADKLKTGVELKMHTELPVAQHIGLNSKNADPDVVSLPESPSSQESRSDLCMVKKYRMRINRDSRNAYVKKLKYRGIRLIPLTPENDINVPQEEQLQPGKDLIFRVRIYRPFTYYIKEKPSRVRHSVFSRDVILVGRQRLSELRDRIVCANDVDMGVDVSHCIDEPPLTTAKELFPSGFLFINNVFYVDTRPGCTDQTEKLRKWAGLKRGGTFPVRDMCAVTVGEISVKLGHPEVYVHRGNCEHLFTISEVRLLNANEPLKLSQYPLHTAISQNQTVYCTTCAEFGAKWMVTDCETVPFDPAFFCDTCLKFYLYKDGQKIGNFKAYTYRGNEINVLKPQG